MSITTRQGLIDYSLRKLGGGVVNVSVTPEQLEDRLDETLQFYQDFHYDGTERVYLKHVITGSDIVVASSANFLPNEVVIGASGAKFTIHHITGNTLTTKGVFLGALDNAPLAVGEVVAGQTSGATSTVISRSTGDIENRYAPVSDMVTSVMRAIPWWHVTNKSTYMFDPQYQVILSTFQNIANASMIYYSQLMSHIALIDQVLRPIDSLRFNRKQSKVFLDFDWYQAEIGGYLVFECQRILDPETVTTIYNDRMLKKLLTAKIKYQWATNTQLYSGIQLLGGVTIDSTALMAQAVAEIEAAENEIRTTYAELPIGFMA